MTTPHRVSGLFALGLCLGLVLCGCSPKPPTHGTSFLIEFGTNDVSVTAESAPSLARAQQVMRNRLRMLGVRPWIETVGTNQLLIKVQPMRPDLLANVRELLSKPGMLHFRMVHPESDLLIKENIREPGHEVLMTPQRTSSHMAPAAAYMVRKNPERGLTGSYIRDAMVTRHHVTDAPEVSIEFDEKGTRLFTEITREYAPKGATYHQLAIVFDGQLYSAPRINEPIEGGRAMITGNFDMREATVLANLLKNPLEAPPRIVQETKF
jgi:preprotein translocase subunit SecD